MQQLVLDLTWVNAGTKDMSQRRLPDSDFGFAAFKLGLLLAAGGFILWLAMLISNNKLAAVVAAVIGALGAQILMFGVLGGRRSDTEHPQS
jgi:hypothetical protein